MKTSELIKKEALYLFALNGYDSTSLNDIANRVGIKKASIYAHYAKKEDLYIEIFNDEFNRYADFLEKCMSLKGDESVTERLYLIFKANVEYYNKNKSSGRLLNRFTFHPSVSLRELVIRQGAIIDTNMNLNGKLAKVFEEGVKRGEIIGTGISDLVSSFYWFCRLVILKMCMKEGEYSIDDVEKEWRFYFKGIQNT